MKIMIATTRGGHLTQSLLLAEKLKSKFDLVFVTHYTDVSKTLLKGYRVKFISMPFTGPKNIRTLCSYPIILFKALMILLRENPDAIVSPGSNVPIPFCYLGKLLGKKIIFIESWSRVRNPSLSGKLIYKIADLFFVQWEPLKKVYPKAVYAGRLL